MPSSSSYPSLPIELIENIISLLWSSSLSVDERIVLMTSSALVNKTWSYVFICISFKDVHIPCPSYCDQYFRILGKGSPIFDDEIKSLPQMLCQSVTLRIEHTPTYPALVSTSSELPMGEVLSNFLYLLDIHNVPNLRTISIEYLNTGYDDIFDNLRFIDLPKQVTDLELTFAFNPRTPQWLVDALRRNQVQHDLIKWALPSIRRLSIKGGSEALITDMVSVCPEMETLEINLPPELETTSSETHLVNLLKRGVNLEEQSNESAPPNKLTVTSRVRTWYLEHWEGVQTNFCDNIYQFQRLNSF